MFGRIDGDDSGQISIDEMLKAYDLDPKVRDLLNLLNISKQTLRELFLFMDEDRSGSINYEEFLRTMRESQMQDIRMQMMLVKLQIHYMSRHMESDWERSRTISSMTRSVGRDLPQGVATHDGKSEAHDLDQLIATEIPSAPPPWTSPANANPGSSGAKAAAAVPCHHKVHVADAFLGSLEAEVQRFREDLHAQVAAILEGSTASGQSFMRNGVCPASEKHQAGRLDQCPGDVQAVRQHSHELRDFASRAEHKEVGRLPCTVVSHAHEYLGASCSPKAI